MATISNTNPWWISTLDSTNAGLNRNELRSIYENASTHATNNLFNNFFNRNPMTLYMLNNSNMETTPRRALSVKVADQFDWLK